MCKTALESPHAILYWVIVNDLLLLAGTASTSPLCRCEVSLDILPPK